MSVLDELRIGGAERLLLDALRYVPRQDVEPSLVLLHEHPHEQMLLHELPADVQVFRLRAPKTKGLNLFRPLLDAVRQVRPDIVHTHLFRSNVWGGLAAHAAGTLHLLTEHGAIVRHGEPQSNDEMSNRKRHLWARKALAALGSQSLAVSEYVAASVSDVAGVSRQHFRVVYNGVDLAKFVGGSGVGVRARLGIPDGAVVFGMCGRLIPWKGGVLFANAARIALSEDRDARVIIVGDGPERAAIEREVAPLADRVHLVGYQANVADYVAAMDVFVAPSRIDTLGIVLYEAMLLGRACLVAKSGSAADPWFRDAPVQFASATATAAELAGDMLRLARDRGLRESLGAAAQRDARERLDIRRVVREYVAVYRALVGGRSNGFRKRSARASRAGADAPRPSDPDGAATAQ
jgi:glycosyltransferase involved in cell wall biosynthesis